MRDRMVTAGDICTTAVAQTRPDQELVALEMFGQVPGTKRTSLIWPTMSDIESEADLAVASIDFRN
jgi:hypothetical protein